MQGTLGLLQGVVLEEGARLGQVGRFGGDEFCLLLTGLNPNRQEATVTAMALAREIQHNLNQPFSLNGEQFKLSACIGVSLFPEYRDTPLDVLRRANTALHYAKQQGNAQTTIFDSSLDELNKQRFAVEYELRQGITTGQLRLYLQSQVDAEGHLVAAETLVRWQHPQRGLVPPVEFIPIAEESGLIGKLGMQVLDKACGMVARLRRRGMDLTCSVNLSLRQFLEFNLVEDIPRVLAAHGLPNSAIRLEITESLVAHSDAELALAMTELHRLGFEFMLDDFGTGHSSLYRLQSLPFQTLKIDRSFVVPLERGDDVMVRTVKDLAEQLSLQVVAEGVETQVELDQLLHLGVHRIQGFLVARPMSDPALMHWLATSSYETQGGDGNGFGPMVNAVSATVGPG